MKKRRDLRLFFKWLEYAQIIPNDRLYVDYEVVDEYLDQIYNNTKVSFDFDGTLSRPSVQKYAKELLELGFDVWVVTARYDEENKHKYPQNATNQDLYDVIKDIGLPLEKVVFMNMEMKSEYFKKHPDFVWHLDDDFTELRFISRETPVKAISVVGNSNWKHKCNRLLKL